MAKTINYDPDREKKVRIIKKCVGFGLLAVFVLLTLFQSFYTVKEQEQAVVLTFGKTKTVSESGLHFKIPYIQQVKKVNTTIQGFPIGYMSDTENWQEEESLMITSDMNFINVDFFVEYQVYDPVKALYRSTDPVGILKSIAQSSIRTVIGSYPVDDVLTTGKSEIQAEIKTMITERLEESDIGIGLVNITMQDAEPPTNEIIAAFKAVETAKQGKETAINNANKYKNEQIPQMEAEVDKILQSAQATKEQRVKEAEGQAARFEALYEEYKKFPAVTRQRMFYEAMEEILPELRVVIDGSETGLEKFMVIGGESSLSQEEQAALGSTAADNADGEGR